MFHSFPPLDGFYFLLIYIRQMFLSLLVNTMLNGLLYHPNISAFKLKKQTEC